MNLVIKEEGMTQGKKKRKTKKKCMQNSNVSKDKTKKAGCVTTIFENQMLQDSSSAHKINLVFR